MLLKALTDGSVTATGTFTTQSSYQGGILGGVLITADGTNAATVTVQKDDSNGKTIFKLVTKSPILIKAPISLEGTRTAYYSVSGTGGAAQFFEWCE